MNFWPDSGPVAPPPPMLDALPPPVFSLPPIKAHDAQSGHATAPSTATSRGRVPRTDRAAYAAVKVAAMAAEERRVAWATLEGEFEVQQKVWESLGLVRGGNDPAATHRGVVASLQSKIELALVTSWADPNGAIGAIEAAMRKCAEEDKFDIFSASMMESGRRVVAAERLARSREELAGLLRSVHENTDYQEYRDMARTEALILECNLQDLKLERCARKALFEGNPAARRLGL